MLAEKSPSRRSSRYCFLASLLAGSLNEAVADWAYISRNLAVSEEYITLSSSLIAGGFCPSPETWAAPGWGLFFCGFFLTFFWTNTFCFDFANLSRSRKTRYNSTNSRKEWADFQRQLKQADPLNQEQEAAEAAEAVEKTADTVVSLMASPRNLSFQIGANKGQMVSVDLPDVATNQLALGVENDSGFKSLADLDVTTGEGAQDAMSVIDKAIEEIAVARGDLGAFQKNTLESNLTSLRIHSENLVAAESAIRDADMAVELAAFTRNQIMTQSATAQLAQANAMPKNVMALLAGQ